MFVYWSRLFSWQYRRKTFCWSKKFTYNGLWSLFLGMIGTFLLILLCWASASACLDNLGRSLKKLMAYLNWKLFQKVINKCITLLQVNFANCFTILFSKYLLLVTVPFFFLSLTLFRRYEIKHYIILLFVSFSLLGLVSSTPKNIHKWVKIACAVRE